MTNMQRGGEEKREKVKKADKTDEGRGRYPSKKGGPYRLRLPR